jgi:hypothetical protein
MPSRRHRVYQKVYVCGRSAGADRFSDRDAPPPGGVPHHVGVDAGGEAGVRVAEMLGDVVQRAPLVEEQRGAGVAEVLTAQVGDVNAPERRNPRAPPPVLSVLGETPRLGSAVEDALEDDEGLMTVGGECGDIRPRVFVLVLLYLIGHASP